MAIHPPKLLIVCSAGGHLREALESIAGLGLGFDLATFRQPHLTAPPPGARSLHYLLDPHVSLWKYAVNAAQSLWLMLRLRPNVVLTTGAGIAIPCALLGKVMGAKLIFVESVASVHALSRTGAFLYRYADLFVVQWPDLCKAHPRAVYGGCIL